MNMYPPPTLGRVLARAAPSQGGRRVALAIEPSRSVRQAVNEQQKMVAFWLGQAEPQGTEKAFQGR
jgi:hypothetical protein